MPHKDKFEPDWQSKTNAKAEKEKIEAQVNFDPNYFYPDMLNKESYFNFDCINSKIDYKLN